MLLVDGVTNGLKFKKKKPFTGGARGGLLKTGFRCRLALGKLEPFTRPGPAGFLTFSHAAVSSEKTGTLQRGTKLLVIFFQGAGDTKSNRECLPNTTSAPHVDDEVELILLLGDLQRRVHFKVKRLQAAEIFRLLAIDQDLALA